jgi:hypothetical protein
MGVIPNTVSKNQTSGHSVYYLTHWGRVTQICVYTHINNLNTLSPMC